MCLLCKNTFYKKTDEKTSSIFSQSFTVWHLYSTIFVANLLRVWSSSSSGAWRREKSCFYTCIACSGWASFVSLSLRLWPQRPYGHLPMPVGTRWHHCLLVQNWILGLLWGQASQEFVSKRLCFFRRNYYLNSLISLFSSPSSSLLGILGTEQMAGDPG